MSEDADLLEALAEKILAESARLDRFSGPDSSKLQEREAAACRRAAALLRST